MVQGINIDIQVFERSFAIIKASHGYKQDISLLGRSLYEARLDFIDEVICTETEICLKLNDRFDYSQLDILYDLKYNEPIETKAYRLPVYFTQTDDMSELMKSLDYGFDEVLKMFHQCTLDVAMLGFIPGFVYLRGLPEKLNLPRKTRPSTRIEEGSFAIASGYAGIYSLPSPGGWHVLGRTACSIINIPDIPPCLLNIGDKIIIESIDEDRFAALQNKNLNILQYNGQL